MYNEATTRRHHGPTGRVGFKPVVPCKIFPFLCTFYLLEKENYISLSFEERDISMKWHYLSAKDPFKPVVLPTPVRAGTECWLVPGRSEDFKTGFDFPVGRAGTPAHLG